MKMLSWVMLVLVFLLGASVFAQTPSQLRVAHLSPDAPTVDVWVDGNRVLQNVAFKGVSNYLSLPAGSYRLQVSPAGAATPIVIDATVMLEAGKAYTAAATGLLGANDLKPLVLVDDLGLDPAKAKVRFVHTSPDAPAVDIAVKNGPVLFGNVKFREAGNYLSVDAGKYDLEVRLAGTNTVALELAGVELIAGTNYSVFAVGQASNNTLAALPVIDQGTAQVRVGHLSPDAPAVDIWVNGDRVLQNVAFKTLSDYLNLSAGEYRIQVSPAGVATPIVIDATVALEANKAYTVAATGLLGANDLKPLVLVDDRTADNQKAKVRFVHTSPDAPTVDIAVKGGPILFGNVKFREASDYLSVDASLYNLEVRLAGTTTVALEVPAVQLAAKSNYVVFAVGLASNGTLSALLKAEVVTSIKDEVNQTVPVEYELSQNHPNPFNPETQIAFTVPANSRVRLVVYDLLGKEVVRLIDGELLPGNYTVRWNGRDARGLQVATGAYIYRLEADNFTQTRRMLYLR